MARRINPHNLPPDHYVELSRIEAERVVRYVMEHHEAIPDGIIIDRFSNGRLRIRGNINDVRLVNE